MALHLCLRLQDFTSVVEADDSMQAGDIGRLMMMWKRWAVMAQEIKGMSHYANHLPCLIVLLEQDSLPHLSQAIKN